MYCQSLQCHRFCQLQKDGKKNTVEYAIVDSLNAVHLCRNAKRSDHSCVWAFCNKCILEKEQDGLSKKKTRSVVRDYARMSGNDPHGKRRITRKYDNDVYEQEDNIQLSKECKHEIHDLEQCLDLTFFTKSYQQKQEEYTHPFPSQCIGCGKIFRAK